jgi:hypothetical protein
VPSSAAPIQDGMAFAWNPSITGVKTEDTVMLRPGALDVLTATGEWPMLDVAAGGRPYQRPAILER